MNEPSPKPQFGTSTLFLVTAFAAIGFAGIAAAIKQTFPALKYDLIVSIFWSVDRLRFAGPFFIPVIFAAYVAGRRRITALLLLVFAAAEGIAVALSTWAT